MVVPQCLYNAPDCIIGSHPANPDDLEQLHRRKKNKMIKSNIYGAIMLYIQMIFGPLRWLFGHLTSFNKALEWDCWAVAMRSFVLRQASLYKGQKVSAVAPLLEAFEVMLQTQGRIATVQCTTHLTSQWARPRSMAPTVGWVRLIAHCINIANIRKFPHSFRYYPLVN